MQISPLRLDVNPIPLSSPPTPRPGSPSFPTPSDVGSSPRLFPPSGGSSFPFSPSSRRSSDVRSPSLTPTTNDVRRPPSPGYLLYVCHAIFLGWTFEETKLVVGTELAPFLGDGANSFWLLHCFTFSCGSYEVPAVPPCKCHHFLYHDE